MSLYFNEKHSPCWPRQSKPSLKLLDYSRKIQSDVHIDTYYRKPELISWGWINITVFHMRFLSPTDQKRMESSKFWQFFYYYPPNKFRFTHIYIYDALRNRYGFSISVQHGIDCTTFHSFFSWKVWKKKFFEIFKSWQVCDWLAKWRSG